MAGILESAKRRVARGVMHGLWDVKAWKRARPTRSVGWVGGYGGWGRRGVGVRGRGSKGGEGVVRAWERRSAGAWGGVLRRGVGRRSVWAGSRDQRDRRDT